MKLHGLILVAGLIICLCACEKDGRKFDIDCDKLVSGIVNMDSDAVRTEIDKLTYDLDPVPTEDDNLGHRNNFDLLVNRIGSSCEEINADMICYACILTLPAQTEIAVTVDSAGFPITRIIDISTPDNYALSCIRVHEYIY